MIARGLNDIISELLVWLTHSSPSEWGAGDAARYKIAREELWEDSCYPSLCFDACFCVLSKTSSVDRE